MTINLAGAAIKDVRVAGAQAQKVMLGTGSAAVEVWPSSIYPVSGTVGGGSYSSASTLASHTVVENGSFTVDWEVTCTEGVWSPQISRGSTVLATGSEVQMQGTGPVSWTGTLNAGDIINFRVTQKLINTVVVSGTWSIVKN